MRDPQLRRERNGAVGEVGNEDRLQAVVLDPLVDAEQLDVELALVRVVDDRPDHGAAARATSSRNAVDSDTPYGSFG